ncbi:ParA family protein [Thermosulfurimonas marina]|uniref:ParA family protein n=1 Tax=Thermosulfurimonas marina TaxID=2047767 RepID=A0A6H1WS80_9BACT|nr:ParA family protein [Thermosulfurimonas marina]QJA06075.1 ParA family protein [Thermosulfurimonas marina]
MILALANQKGGVGKTTVAVNLAAALAERGRRVLLVDTDPQANASSGLGIRVSAERSLYAALVGRVPVEKLLVKTPFGLDLLPSSVELAGAEAEFLELPERERLLQRTLSPLFSRYHFVLVDLPPSLGILTVNGLCASQGVIIPLQCEYYALEGLSLLVRTLRRVREGLNRDLFLFGIILTMYDKRNRLSREVAEEVRRHFRGTVFEEMIPRTVRLSEAPSHGKPITVYDPRGPAAEAFRRLAKEVEERARQEKASG